MPIFIHDQNLQKADDAIHKNLLLTEKFATNGETINAHSMGNELGGGIYSNGNLLFSDADRSIFLNGTSRLLTMAPSTDGLVSNGSSILLYGINSVGNEGNLVLRAGNHASVGNIYLRTGNNVSRVTIDKDGNSRFDGAVSIGIAPDTTYTFYSYKTAANIVRVGSAANVYLTLDSNVTDGLANIQFRDVATTNIIACIYSSLKSADQNLVFQTRTAGGILTTALTIDKTQNSTFVGAIASSNYGAANKLTACATNAGAIDFSAGSKILTIADSCTLNQSLQTTDHPQFAYLGLGIEAASNRLIRAYASGTAEISLSSNTDVANLYLDGTSSYFIFRNTSSTQKSSIYSDNSTGILNFTTGGSTLALTLDASQNATFASNILLGAKQLFINDTANAKQVVGLTVNQGVNDDEIFTCKSSDVGHPFTDYTEADTYFAITKWNGGAGGSLLAGYIDADISRPAISIAGYVGSASPTQAAIELYGAKTDGGTAAAALANSEQLLRIRNYGSDKFIMYGNGDATFYGASTIFNTVALTGNHCELTLNCYAGKEAGIYLKDGSTNKWEVYKRTDNDFAIFNTNLSADSFKISTTSSNATFYGNDITLDSTGAANDNSFLYLKSKSSSYVAGIDFWSAADNKWFLGKDSTTEDFYLHNYDVAAEAFRILKSNNSIIFGSTDYIAAENAILKIKTYAQAAEPTLAYDNYFAFWKDTDDSNKIYLVYRRGSGDQVKVQLS